MKLLGLRVEVDHSDDRFQKKIRNAQMQKVPFMMIAGQDDIEAGAVSFRYRDGRQDNGVPIDEAIARVATAVTRGSRYERVAEETTTDTVEVERGTIEIRLAVTPDDVDAAAHLFENALGPPPYAGSSATRATT